MRNKYFTNQTKLMSKLIKRINLKPYLCATNMMKNDNIPKFRTKCHNSGSSTILEQFKQHSRILNPHNSLNI